jgi:hypothetical protein
VRCRLGGVGTRERQPPASRLRLRAALILATPRCSSVASGVVTVFRSSATDCPASTIEARPARSPTRRSIANSVLAPFASWAGRVVNAKSRASRARPAVPRPSTNPPPLSGIRRGLISASPPSAAPRAVVPRPALLSSHQPEIGARGARTLPSPPPLRSVRGNTNTQRSLVIRTTLHSWNLALKPTSTALKTSGCDNRVAPVQQPHTSALKTSRRAGSHSPAVIGRPPLSAAADGHAEENRGGIGRCRSLLS